MIEITYENEDSPYGSHFSAYFETERGAIIFMGALDDRLIDYTVKEGVEP